jgi:serine/threonine protein kinase/tetratricopeptide (TPR) repeat protein
MNPDQWQRVKQVLEQVVALDSAARRPYLDRACGEDLALRGEVESLLASHEQAGTSFLQSPAVALRADVPPLSTRAGRRVGVYQIIEEIGHGGMGEVYRAVRADGQYTKEVAVKLVRGGFDSRSVLERFFNERQILASLDHPNIGRLLDGGTTDDGIPYLAMELIEGTRIDSYCDEHRLSITERLQLFRQVCGAVQYAHQRLVIHRDIKPSNILVTKDGVPKLLDFGIAKILDPAGAGAETTLARPMTPEYASPEQIRGEAITTASDVYSLGVVLYQLLAGRSPYPKDTSSPHELARAVCDTQPARPSTAVFKPPAGQQVSSAREGSPAKLRRRLAGDLDNIVLMALRKEPQRRYATVEQLAEDIRRHLDGLPVTATKGSWSYRAGKFVSRHKTGVAAVTAAGLALTVGIAATLREARIASENQRKAEQRFNDVRKLADSLMFEIHDSIEGLPGATASRKLIVQRSREYLDRLAQEATGDVSLQRELASAYEKLGSAQGDMYGASLGDAKGGLQSLQKALAIRQVVASANPQNVEDRIALARVYQETGRLQWYTLGGTKEGLESLQQAVANGELAVRMDSQNLNAIEVLARSYQYLGDIQGGSGLRGGTSALHQALENHLKALPLLQKVADATPSDPEKPYLLSRVTIGVGDDYVRTGDAEQALKSYQRAEEILRPIAEKVNNSVYRRGYAVCHTRMGDALLMIGRPAEALSHYRREWQILQPLAAADPKDMVVQSTAITSEGDVGHAMVEAGQVQQGKATLLRAMAKTTAYVHAIGDSYSRVFLASTAALVGEAFERSGEAATAQGYYGQALDLYVATAAADPADTEDAVNVVIMHNHLGGAHLKLGQTEEALEDYRKAFAGEESLAASNPDNVELLYAQADTYAGLGDTSAALAQRGTSATDRSRRWSQAQDWYSKSLSTWQRIPNPGHVSPNLFQVSDRHEIAQRLSRCKLRLAGVER